MVTEKSAQIPSIVVWKLKYETRMYKQKEEKKLNLKYTAYKALEEKKWWVSPPLEIWKESK